MWSLMSGSADAAMAAATPINAALTILLMSRPPSAVSGYDVSIWVPVAMTRPPPVTRMAA